MPLLQQADVMLCDSSSIILEFMFLDKPVVTFRNSHPGPHLIDVDTPEAVGPAIERALTRPEGLMGEIRSYTMHHEPHRDCRCSARVLDAVDDYIVRGHAGLKRKPLNLVRKWKVRGRWQYYPRLQKFRPRENPAVPPLRGGHGRLWMPFPGPDVSVPGSMARAGGNGDFYLGFGDAGLFRCCQVACKPGFAAGAVFTDGLLVTFLVGR